MPGLEHSLIHLLNLRTYVYFYPKKLFAPSAGGGKKTKLWFELLEWLIKRGARKFVVALDNFSVDPKISHQINRLLVQKKATIILTTLKKADTAEDAASLIAEANNVAPLEAIFFVSLVRTPIRKY